MPKAGEPEAVSATAPSTTALMVPPETSAFISNHWLSPMAAGAVRWASTVSVPYWTRISFCSLMP